MGQCPFTRESSLQVISVRRDICRFCDENSLNFVFQGQIISLLHFHAKINFHCQISHGSEVASEIAAEVTAEVAAKISASSDVLEEPTAAVVHLRINSANRFDE